MRLGEANKMWIFAVPNSKLDENKKGIRQVKNLNKYKPIQIVAPFKTFDKHTNGYAYTHT